METSVLTSKGQLLIPKRLRNKYGIKLGVKVAFIETANGLMLKAMDEAYFDQFAGLLKDAVPTTAEYKEWKKEERAKENKGVEKKLAHRLKKLNEKSCIRQLCINSLFRQEAGYELVRELLVKIAADEMEGYITAINIGEVYYMICLKSNQQNAEIALDALLKFPLQIVDAGLQLSIEAAKLKAKYTLSYADAFAAALTIAGKATLMTGDDEFESLKNEAGFKVKYL